jgi:hypothetical protein
MEPVRPNTDTVSATLATWSPITEPAWPSHSAQNSPEASTRPMVAREVPSTFIKSSAFIAMAVFSVPQAHESLRRKVPSDEQRGHFR